MILRVNSTAYIMTHNSLGEESGSLEIMMYYILYHIRQ